MSPEAGGGGGGFSSGADFVAAKVSLEVDTAGIQSLKEFSQQMDRYRTSAETAARGSSSFTGMLQQMTQAANMATEALRNMGQVQERTADFQQRMQTGGVGGSAQLPLSRSAPQGFVDNFAGMGVGMGMGGGRASPSDVPQQLAQQQQQIDTTRQADPRKYINAQAGRARLIPGELTGQPPGGTDWGSHADRVEARDRTAREQDDKTGEPPIGAGVRGHIGHYAGLAGNMINEMAPSRNKGVVGMAKAGLGGLAAWGGGGSRPSAAAASGAAGAQTAVDASEGDAATALGAKGAAGGDALFGGAMGMLGKAGGIGAALMGIMGLVQKGGSKVQGFKNTGLIQGGGAAQGLGDEMRIRAMALDPFLTTEQARSVVMAGLSEGYRGAQFDTVTKFIAQNLKDMNMDVGTQVQFLRKSVHEGGESIGDLNKQFKEMKDMAKSGTMSLPDIVKSTKETSGALISAGVPGKAAMEAGMSASQMWNTEDTRAMKGQGGPLMTALAEGGDAAGAGLAMFGGASVPGLMPGAEVEYLGEHGGASAIQGAMDKELSGMVHMLFRGNPPEGSVQYANAMHMLATRVLPKFFPGEQLTKDQLKTMVKKYMGGQSASGRPMEVPAGPTGAPSFGASPPAAAPSAPASTPMLNNIVSQYGAGNIQVVDDRGNASPYTGSTSQQQSLTEGQATWKRKGEQGRGQTLAQTAAGGGGGKTDVSFQPALVTVKVDMVSGKATVSPNPVRLTPNQIAANSGVGSAAMNNPPPGDGVHYGGVGEPGLR